MGRLKFPKSLGHKLTVNLTVLFVGFVLLYLGCWMTDASVIVQRWDPARCGFAIFGSLITFAYYKMARKIDKDTGKDEDEF